MDSFGRPVQWRHDRLKRKPIARARLSSFLVRLAIFVGVIFFIFWLAQHAWQAATPVLKNVGLVVPTSSISDAAKELEAKKAAEAKAKIDKESDQLHTLIANFAAHYPGQVSIVATDLDNGATANVNAKEVMTSASIYKLFVAYGIYQKIQQGQLTSDTRMDSLPSYAKTQAVLTDPDNDDTGGVGLRAGITIDGCLKIMLANSDNDCGFALGTIDNWAQLDKTLHNLGYTCTTLNNYNASGTISGDKQTCATDVAEFLTALYQYKLLSKASTDECIAFLKQDSFTQWLPSGLPAGTPIAHKIGDLYNYIHDAGIVYSPKGNYLVVMMSKGWGGNPMQSSIPAFKSLSSQLWNYFTS